MILLVRPCLDKDGLTLQQSRMSSPKNIPIGMILIQRTLKNADSSYRIYTPLPGNVASGTIFANLIDGDLYPKYSIKAITQEASQARSPMGTQIYLTSAPLSDKNVT